MIPPPIPPNFDTGKHGRGRHVGQGCTALAEVPRRRSQTRSGLVRSLLRNRKAVTGLIMLAIFFLLALLTPLLAPGNPSLITSIGATPPSSEHWLGTTPKGQDVLALTMWGSRASLLVGFTVGLAATAIGILVGLASAYFGRLIDDSLSLVTNIFLLLPGLPLLVMLAAFLPPGRATIILVLAVTGWAGSARVLRAQAKSIRGKDFVAAAVVTGERPLRIMFREILPNMASVVMTTLLGLRHLRHRRPGRPGVPWPGRQQRRQLGHQPVLGQQRRRADDRRLVGLRPVGIVHRTGRVRPCHDQLRGRRDHQPAAATMAAPPHQSRAATEVSL